jgi:hypothetical protein
MVIPNYERPDETPVSFAEMKPPGYWSKTLGYFVEVRAVSYPPDEDAWWWHYEREA